MILGFLARLLYNDSKLIEKCLLVNTIHDSIILDVHEDVLDYALPILNKSLTLVPDLYKKQFGQEFNLPTKGDVEIGLHWGDMSIIDVDLCSKTIVN